MLTCSQGHEAVLSLYFIHYSFFFFFFKPSAPSKKSKPSGPKGTSAPAKAKKPESKDVTEVELSVNKAPGFFFLMLYSMYLCSMYKLNLFIFSLSFSLRCVKRKLLRLCLRPVCRCWTAQTGRSVLLPWKSF